MEICQDCGDRIAEVRHRCRRCYLKAYRAHRRAMGNINRRLRPDEKQYAIPLEEA